MANGGWIKLHRSLLDNPVILRDPECFSIWIFLLLKAAHKDGVKVAYSGTQCTLAAGQVVTSRKDLSEQLNIHESKVQRVLSRLQKEQMIEQQTSNRKRVISIVNWDKYQFTEQQTEQPNEQQVNSNRTASEQQSELHTLYNKKYKNDKNDNKYNSARTHARHAVGVPVDNNDKFTPVMDSEARKNLDKVRENIRRTQAEMLAESEAGR